MVYSLRKRLEGIQTVDRNVYEYDSLIYEAGATGFWSRSGNGSKGERNDVDMSQVRAYV